MQFSAYHKQAFSELTIDENQEADFGLELFVKWLQQFSNTSKNSLVTHRTVILRFFLWLKFKKLSLTQLKLFDIYEYINFMANPDPAWIGKRLHFKDPNWKPFFKPLSKTIINFNTKILKKFIADLYDDGYLTKNITSKLKTAIIKPLSIDHYLTIDEFKIIIQYITKFKLDGFLCF